MHGEKSITRVFLDVCEKCCDKCIEDGRELDYCIDICGCNCDELYDDIDYLDDEECEEDWEDEEDYEWW